jgi:uncharacterized protein (TIGR03086 family)
LPPFRSKGVTVTEIQELYTRALEQFGRKVHAIRDDQWSNPTPCADWDVRALVNHLVNENLWVPPLVEGKTIEEVGDRLDGDLLGDDPFTAWDAAAKGGMAAMTEPGAMDRTVHLSFGDTAASEYANQVFTDLAVHGWDLARGTGADERIHPEFVDVLYAQAAPMEEELKSYGVFGGKVVPPEGADKQTKLLAIFGRVA